MMRIRAKTFKNTICAASILSLCLSGLYPNISMAASGSSGSAWLQNLALQESSNNQYQTNPYSTAVGSYQMTEGALASAGYIKENSPVTAANYNGNLSNVTFTGKDGVTSLSSFESNPQAQAQAAQTYSQQVWNTMEQNGTVSRYLGKTINGQVMNKSALLSGGYVLGPGGMSSYLANGGKVYNSDGSYNAALTNVAAKRIANGSQYDASSITGSYTTVADSQPGSFTNGSTPTTVASAAMDCNPYVAKLLKNQAMSFINNAKTAAESPQTGYTLLNGNSVAQAAGLAPGGSTAGGSTGSFGAFSCLSNLVGGNMNVLFEPPNLSAIVQQIEQTACNAAENQFRSLTQPITSQLFSSSDFGSYFPGLNLGGLAGGYNVGFSQNGSGSYSISTNGSTLSSTPSVTQQGQVYYQSMIQRGL